MEQLFEQIGPLFWDGIHTVQIFGIFRLLCVVFLGVIIVQFLLLRKRKKQNILAELFLKEIRKYDIYKNPTVQESLRILAQRRLDNVIRLENRGILRELVKKDENDNGGNGKYSSAKKYAGSPESAPQATEATSPRVQLTETTRTVDGDEESIKNIITSAKQGEKK